MIMFSSFKAMLINEGLKVMMVKIYKQLKCSKGSKCRIYADYLLVDSWYAKTKFYQRSKRNGLFDVIARVSKSNKIWQFIG